MSKKQKAMKSFWRTHSKASKVSLLWTWHIPLECFYAVIMEICKYCQMISCALCHFFPKQFLWPSVLHHSWFIRVPPVHTTSPSNSFCPSHFWRHSWTREIRQTLLPAPPKVKELSFWLNYSESSSLDILKTWRNTSPYNLLWEICYSRGWD